MRREHQRRDRDSAPGWVLLLDRRLLWPGPLLFAIITTCEGATLSPHPGDTRGENRCFPSSEGVEHLLGLFKGLRPGHVGTFCLRQ